MEVAETFDAAVGELHTELSAIAETGNGVAERFGKVVTCWLQESNRLCSIIIDVTVNYNE